MPLTTSRWRRSRTSRMDGARVSVAAGATTGALAPLPRSGTADRAALRQAVSPDALRHRDGGLADRSQPRCDPSRVPPAARPGPDSIPPGGAEGTRSEPGYGSLGGGTVPPDRADGGCSESSAAGPRPATSPPSRSRLRCRAAHSAGGGAARPSAQQPVQCPLR